MSSTLPTGSPDGSAEDHTFRSGTATPVDDFLNDGNSSEEGEGALYQPPLEPGRAAPVFHEEVEDLGTAPLVPPAESNPPPVLQQQRTCIDEVPQAGEVAQELGTPDDDAERRKWSPSHPQEDTTPGGTSPGGTSSGGKSHHQGLLTIFGDQESPFGTVPNSSNYSMTSLEEMLPGARSISEAELNQLRPRNDAEAAGAVLVSIFTNADTDCDGFISFEELQVAIAHLGWVVSSAELTQVVQEIQAAQPTLNQENPLSDTPGEEGSIADFSGRETSSHALANSTTSDATSAVGPSVACVLTLSYNFAFFSKVIELLQNKVRLETFNERPTAEAKHIEESQQTKCFLPDSSKRWFWNVFIVFSTVAMILAAGFEVNWREAYATTRDNSSWLEPSTAYDIFEVLLVPDILMTLIMLVDFVVNVFTVYVQNQEFIKVFIDDPKELLRIKVRTPAFYLDLFAALPLFAIGAAVGPENAVQRDVAAWLNVLRAASKLWRLSDLFDLSSGFPTLNYWHVTKYYTLSPPLLGLTYLVTILHSSAVIFIYIQETVGQMRYAEAFYFSVTVLSSVGYGDVSPATTTQRIFVTVLCCVEMMVDALVVGSAIGFAQTGDMGSRQREAMLTLDAVLNFFEIPKGLADEVRQFQNYLSFHNLLDTHHDLLSNLPTDITKNLDVYSKIRAISTVPFLSDAPASVKLGLAHVLRQTSATPETPLLHCGLVSEAMYFILYGFVSLYTSTGRHLATLKEGQYLGELSLLTKNVGSMKKSISARTMTYCLLFELRRDDFELLASEFPRFKAQLVMASRHLIAAMNDDESGDTVVEGGQSSAPGSVSPPPGLSPHIAPITDLGPAQGASTSDWNKLSDFIPDLDEMLDNDADVQNFVRGKSWKMGWKNQSGKKADVLAAGRTSPASGRSVHQPGTSKWKAVKGLIKVTASVSAGVTSKTRTASPSPKSRDSAPAPTLVNHVVEGEYDAENEMMDLVEEDDDAVLLERMQSVVKQSGNSASLMPQSVRKPNFSAAAQLGASVGLSAAPVATSRRLPVGGSPAPGGFGASSMANSSMFQIDKGNIGGPVAPGRRRRQTRPGSFDSSIRNLNMASSRSQLLAPASKAVATTSSVPCPPLDWKSTTPSSTPSSVSSGFSAGPLGSGPTLGPRGFSLFGVMATSLRHSGNPLLQDEEDADDDENDEPEQGDVSSEEGEGSGSEGGAGGDASEGAALKRLTKSQLQQLTLQLFSQLEEMSGELEAEE